MADNQDRSAGAVPESATRNFRRRVASALVLAPIVILAAYLGGAVFVALCALAAAAVLWEWSKVVARSAEPRILAPGFAALALAAIFIVLQQPSAAIVTVAVGTVVVGAAVAAWPRSAPPPIAPVWGAGGVVYGGIVLVCPALLRNDPEFGLQALLFLFATVWATDIFAYLTGRTFGGPLLWPQLSPNKTWSGAFGGLLGGVAAGAAVAYASGGTRGVVAGVLALVLSIVAQGGDLFESAIKRRFGVKDTSHLIPGHGGVMDRLDGFLVAALAAVLIGILRQGVAAPARGLLAW
ncbi:MAG TPA: phosphatidate cytidylyltransferase [Xanthobacteraceae bacterium]|jgi:phosphatidate cytidylyltransferase|nr:phosphatidate cytidylyltransferase [Xanthobacteraceae bacterium]